MKVYSNSIGADHYDLDCGIKGTGVSPHICIKDAPEGTVSYAVMIEDRDAFPVSQGFSWVHWCVCNITDNEIEKGASKTDKDIIQGLNSNISPQGGSCSKEDSTGYCPMSPPNEAHLYVIHVYALDTMLNLQTGFAMHELYRAMRGHVLDSADIDAWYDKVR